MRLLLSMVLSLAALFGSLRMYAQVNLGPDTSHCTSTPLVLDAGPGFSSYAWSSGQSTQTLTVQASGTYRVTVTDTASNTFSDTIVVTLRNQPIAVFLGNNFCLGTPIPFINLTQSSDSIASWLWEFGNGDTSTAFQPSYLYPSQGIKYVRLTATTIYGCFDTVTNPVEVFGLPFVDAGQGDSINVGETVQLNGSTAAQTYSWEPADLLDFPNELDPETSPSFSTIYTLSVMDSIGCENSDTVLIYVNIGPEALNDLVSLSIGSNLSFDVTTNDVDINGDSLTLSILNGPSNGTAAIAGTSIEYIPETGFNGRDTITYQVCDEGNPPLCDIAYLIITISNSAPIANNDTLSLQVNESATVSVLLNDQDPNGQNITISEISTPSHGTVTDLSNGLLQYSANEGYVGTDSFFYTLCDNGSPILCDTGYVFVTIGQLPLKVLNSFSPNGDGKLDKFIIEGVSAYPNNKLTVFSRWGDIVFEMEGYNNEWDGRRDFNEDLPEGIYYYQFDSGNGTEQLTGWVMLKR